MARVKAIEGFRLTTSYDCGAIVTKTASASRSSPPTSQFHGISSLCGCIASSGYTSTVKRTIYPSIEGLLRLLAAIGGLWIMLLLAVTEPWASSHMTRWWACALIDVSGTLCLLVGVGAIVSSRRFFVISTLYGACAVGGLGMATIVTSWNGSSMMSRFGLAFFGLAVSIPTLVAILCSYHLRRSTAASEV